jgi:hypothetical protein
MIETLKIITGIYDNKVTEGIFELDPNTRTRGHSKKIKKKFCKINVRKFSFTNRIIDLWNTLPQSVIDAKDVRQFAIWLDKYWEHQDVKFEYKASIQNKENTGNHTDINCITEEVEVDIVVESQRPQMTWPNLIISILKRYKLHLNRHHKAPSIVTTILTFKSAIPE